MFAITRYEVKTCSNHSAGRRMTVSEAFQTFKSELELPDQKQKLAASAQQELRSRIANHLYVPDSVLVGSYSRHTKIDPLNDIDILLIRNSQRVGLTTDGSGLSPAHALSEVVTAVRQAYPRTATIETQSRSVNVQLPDLSFGFDIVPAWLRYPDGYWIPDTQFGGWIPTNPDAHARLMTDANVHCDGKLKPLIKMVKHWSRNNFDLIRSFHLELICAHIFSREKLTSFSFGVATFLVHAQKYVGREFLDPAYRSSRVDKVLSQHEETKIRQRMHHDAENSLDALKLEGAGRQVEAIEKWKYIFMSGFPR